MFFFILNNIDVDFLKRKLWLRFYTIKKTFFTTKQAKFIEKKEFIAAALYLIYEVFIIHIDFFNSLSND